MVQPHIHIFFFSKNDTYRSPSLHSVLQERKVYNDKKKKKEKGTKVYIFHHGRAYLNFYHFLLICSYTCHFQHINSTFLALPHSDLVLLFLSLKSSISPFTFSQFIPLPLSLYKHLCMLSKNPTSARTSNLISISFNWYQFDSILKFCVDR